MTSDKLMVTDKTQFNDGKLKAVLTPGIRIIARGDANWHFVMSHSRGIDIVFARIVDAERAIASLTNAGLTDAEKIQAAGIEEARRIIAEAMAW